MPQYELNLRGYSRILRKRRWIIILVFLVVFISTLVYTSLQPPVYEASATVRYTESHLGGTNMSREWSPVYPDTFVSGMLTQARIARGTAVVERAARKSGLLKPGVTEEETRNIVASLQDHISTEVEPDTNIIRIIVRHSDPELAARLANKVARAYIKENLKEKLQPGKNVIRAIEERLDKIKTELNRLEVEIKDFRTEHSEITSTTLTIYQQLEDLRNERDKVTHPTTDELNEKIEELELQLGNNIDNVMQLSRLIRDKEINDRLYRELMQKREAVFTTEARKVSDVSIVDEAIVPVRPISPDKTQSGLVGLVIGLILGLVAAFVVEYLDTSIATIEEVENLLGKVPVVGVIPYIQTADTKPSLLEKVMRGWKTPVRTDGTFPPEADLKRLFLPEAGLKHLFKVASGDRVASGDLSRLLKSQLVLNFSPGSPITEAYRMLRTNIIRSAAEGEPRFRREGKERNRIILLTSAGPKEGKTLTAVNLAITMAQHGELVLLVDANMRQAVIHKIFGLDKGPGLSDLLMGTSKLDDTIRTIADTLVGGLAWEMVLSTPRIDNLHIITAGTPVPNPAELISSADTGVLLRDLRARYDYVLFDCSAVIPDPDTGRRDVGTTDPLMLGPKAEAVILVYQAGRTARRDLIRAKGQLQNADIDVKGIVLNHKRPAVESTFR